VFAAIFFLEGRAGESPASVDYSVYAALLKAHVRDGLVDYAALKTDARLPAVIARLEQTDLAPLSRAEQLAYWINTYNAVTLKLMADAWPVESIMKINGGKPWDLPLFTPHGAGTAITLNHIEHDIVRKQFDEPRIHFVLVCAAISCPPLISEPYEASKLEAQLERQTRAFLRDLRRNRYDAAEHRLRLSPLFDWYANDFGGANRVPDYVRPYLREADQRALSKVKRPPAVVFTDYNWSPNATK
jgi:hypothetical protein